MRHREIKWENCLDHFFGFFKVGEGFFLISSIAKIGLLLANGGSPSAISIAVIPRDQISTLLVYFEFSSIKNIFSIIDNFFFIKIYFWKEWKVIIYLKFLLVTEI